MPELENPKKDYSDYYKDLHAENVSAYFESLVEIANIDEKQNAVTVSEYKALQAQVDSTSQSRSGWRTLRVWLIILAILATIVAVFAGGNYYYLCLFTLGAFFFIALKINPTVNNLDEIVAKHEAARDVKGEEAWAQMAPLNNQHQWGIPKILFQATLPEIEFDDYLTTARLEDLWSNYGLSPSFNDGKSMLAVLGGTYKENPFAMGKYLQHWIGQRRYDGYLTIYWNEQVQNSEGKWETVQRSQTLNAWVSKPFPEYSDNSTVIYGHDAAPDLSFSRTPSKHSDKEGRSLESGVNRAVKKVERAARKDVKSGQGNLTVMANREFEALFNATNRDHEIQFRLLYTALAQQHTVELLKDRKEGYGDDFNFSKYGMVNFIEPQHLTQTRIDGDPELFRFMDMVEARKFFNNFNNDYFKSLFFGLAPLLTIPSYRDHRSQRSVAPTSSAMSLSFWEHEALANYLGEGHFSHPNSVTRNILKTSAQSLDEYSTVVEVIAYGYEPHTLVEYVAVLGNDGNWHQVPVEWVHYEPVHGVSKLLISQLLNMDNPEKSRSWEQAITSWEEQLRQSGIGIDSYFIWGNVAAVRVA